jgi:D-specific alpha-keto acid dehydrogenase
MNQMGITVYGCEADEAALFRTLSPRFDVRPDLIHESVSERNATQAWGNACISVGHKSALNEAMLMALEESGVKYISTRSIGCNHIDVKAAERMGITVGNTAYSPDSVADYTLMLMLMALRNAKSVLSRALAYDFTLHKTRGRELRDMTIGVAGAGRIGGAVIERLKGFGCRVLVYDHGRNKAALSVSLEEMLQNSDVVTLHLPLNEETYHIIGPGRIEMMKPGAFLINTGRGALIDTAALIEALLKGKLGGAALDVLEGEEGIFYFDYGQRPIDNQFLIQLQRMPNVIITPHSAYYTGHALFDTVENTILNCLDFERSLMR